MGIYVCILVEWVSCSYYIVGHGGTGRCWKNSLYWSLQLQLSSDRQDCKISSNSTGKPSGGAQCVLSAEGVGSILQGSGYHRVCLCSYRFTWISHFCQSQRGYITRKVNELLVISSGKVTFHPVCFLSIHTNCAHTWILVPHIRLDLFDEIFLHQSKSLPGLKCNI